MKFIKLMQELIVSNLAESLKFYYKRWNYVKK